MQKDAPIGPDYIVVSNAHDKRIDAVRKLLNYWPDARDGIGDFIDVFWPLDTAEKKASGTRGCTSGHEVLDDGARAAYVTVYDPIGCCEGLWHEYGHLRLRALGIDLETHDQQLLMHHDEERFVSPIRRDVTRPMSAVVHGVYCWTLFTAGDVRLWRAGYADEIRGTLAWNLPKIEDGIRIMARDALWTDEGEAWAAEFFRWADSVVSVGWDLLGRENRLAAIAANLKWVREQPVSESLLESEA